MPEKTKPLSNAGRAFAYHETRRQGTLSFPCTMYFADSSEHPEGTPFQVKPHWHDSVEILHFEKGTYTLNADMEQMTLESEAFVFIESGALHAIRCAEGYLEQAVLFLPSILSPENEDASAREILLPLSGARLSLPLILREGERGFEKVKEGFARIRDIFASRGEIRQDQRFVTQSAGQLRVKAALMEILASLQEEGLVSLKEQRPDPRMEALKQTLLYIRENYAGRIYVRDLAAIMHMNEQYFCRFFKRTLGRTPVAYINEIRIRQATLLIEQTDEPVLDIALECGYGNAGHFISEFKKFTGCTPLTYRQIHRRKEQAGLEG